MRTDLSRDIPDATKTVGQLYGVVGKDTLVLVAAAEIRLVDPQAQLDATLAGMRTAGIEVVDIDDVDPAHSAGPRNVAPDPRPDSRSRCARGPTAARSAC